MQDFAPLRVLGLMSGTSMDGVDGAVLQTDGMQIFDFAESAFRPFLRAEIDVLTTAQGLWPGDDPDRLAAALAVVQSTHADIVGEFDDVDVVGFHGQTLAHDPANGRTHQLGDGAALARVTGVKTVWDFRSNDMRQGGQGAPLVPFFHFACAKWAELSEPCAFLNLGGVGNVTLIDPRKSAPEDEGALLAFDTGPANAPLNDLMMQRLGREFDENGALAATGTVNETVLRTVMQRPYFGKTPPKSLDRYDFHDALDLVSGLNDADAAATLTALPAACVAANLGHLPFQPQQWFVCGGGAENSTMMAELQRRLSGQVLPIDVIGLDGGMLEAQAFAFLAVRCLRGLPLTAPMTTGCTGPATGGQIATP